MTLEEHFGLGSTPFPEAATESSLLRHTALQEVLDKLRFARCRDTVALLVAESGCGKSTSLALFARSLDTGSCRVPATSLTTVGPFGLISHLAANSSNPLSKSVSANTRLGASPPDCHPSASTSCVSVSCRMTLSPVRTNWARR